MATELLPTSTSSPPAIRASATSWILASSPAWMTRPVRLFGWDREDLADRLVQGFSCFVIGAVGSIIVASAVRLVWLFAL